MEMHVTYGEKPQAPAPEQLSPKDLEKLVKDWNAHVEALRSLRPTLAKALHSGQIQQGMVMPANLNSRSSQADIKVATIPDSGMITNSQGQLFIDYSRGYLPFS